VPAGASLAGELLPMFAVGPGGLSVRFRWVSDLRLRQKAGVIAAVKLSSILQYSLIDYRPVSIPAAKVRRPIVETALVRGDVVVRRNGGGSGLAPRLRNLHAPCEAWPRMKHLPRTGECLFSWSAIEWGM
jgi:hypothetical protein